ncbi:MAG: deoxyribodipyrimidine photo-lyase [Minwuia sp.]|nr:deoxyribodipyrimidine photo-lyase [Minwuia sp.]
MAEQPVIVWFRQDLRLSDNPALHAALSSGRPVIPVYVLDDENAHGWAPGGASRWWLHKSLQALGESIAARGGTLVLRKGPADRVIPDLVAETGASGVFWNRLYEPHAIRRDSDLKAALKGDGVTVHSYAGNLAFEPWTVRTGDDGPYRVFSPFMKACLRSEPPGRPLGTPNSLPMAALVPDSEPLDSWNLLPTKPDWAGGLREHWTPGEAGAAARFEAFLDDRLDEYAKARDRMDENTTSRLSPHLHFGEIGVRTIWHTLNHREDAGARSVGKFRAEVIWREFAYHLLYHYPSLPEANWRDAFDAFPWQDDPASYEAWCQGKTGYPLVDAGMQELWISGYMHNRVRMVAASFLIKHLMTHWKRGEEWFWDTLVDADLANNAASWQWVAGSGADAAPYFRIFNPIRQGEQFDPKGVYVRRWLPVLKDLPDKYVHAPWTAPDAVLKAADVRLGENYPHPVVDHAEARKRALAGYRTMKGEDA